MKKIAFLFPLVLSACFPVVIPVKNPMDEAPNVYGAWRLNDIGGFSPNDPNAVFTINNSDDGFSAVSDCIKVSGRYSIGGNRILAFNQMQVDNRCAENIAERRLPQELGNVRSYRFNSRHLELLNEQGRVILAGKRFRNEKAVGQPASGETLYLLDARRH